MNQYRRRTSFSTIAALVGVGAFIVFCCVSSCAGLYETYSAGSRSGLVTKFSRSGFVSFTSTWEGTLNLGGSASATGIPFNFSVRDEDEVLIGKLKRAVDTGERVVLEYHQWWVKPAFYKTDYRVTDVKLIEGTPPSATPLPTAAPVPAPAPR